MLRSLAEHVPCARIDVLDMVDGDNKLAVRLLEKKGRQARIRRQWRSIASMVTALRRIGELGLRRSGR